MNFSPLDFHFVQTVKTILEIWAHMSHILIGNATKIINKASLVSKLYSEKTEFFVLTVPFHFSVLKKRLRSLKIWFWKFWEYCFYTQIKVFCTHIQFWFSWHSNMHTDNDFFCKKNFFNCLNVIFHFLGIFSILHRDI